MDAGTLRIILIVLGALLLGALYLWERRRIENEAEPEEHSHERPFDVRRREPSFGARFSDAVADTGRAEDASAAAPDAQARRRADPDLASYAGDTSAGADALDSDESDSTHPGLSAGDSDSEAPEHAESSSSSVQQRPASTSSVDSDSLLVQLFVVARDEPFDGSTVQAVAERQHLTPGEMDIYHRHNLDGSSQRALFSVANLVNPGTFPFDEMETFTTPGLALFTQFEGRPSDLMVYDELVQTARSMADILDADLLLPNRRPFDIDAWEGLRIELLSLINERSEAL